MEDFRRHGTFFLALENCLKLLQLTGKTGKAVGEEMYATAKEGDISEASYKWLQPGGGDEQVDKVSFYTKVDDQVCGVGFYPQ